jgi:transcriptional regulator with XRE-family HTH domain
MSPAELKTAREACGLSQGWLAERAGVNIRTVRYWEDGRAHSRDGHVAKVPDDVATIIAEADALIARAAREEYAKLSKQFGKPEDVVLYRYRTDTDLWQHRADMVGYPVTYHAAMLHRAAIALRDIGAKVDLLWVDSKPE